MGDRDLGRENDRIEGSGGTLCFEPLLKGLFFGLRGRAHDRNASLLERPSEPRIPHFLRRDDVLLARSKPQDPGFHVDPHLVRTGIFDEHAASRAISHSRGSCWCTRGPSCPEGMGPRRREVPNRSGLYGIKETPRSTIPLQIPPPSNGRRRSSCHPLWPVTGECDLRTFSRIGIASPR